MKTLKYICRLSLRKGSLFFLILCASVSFGQNILQKSLTEPVIEQMVNNIDSWRKQKLQTWQADIQNLPQSEKDKIIATAEKVKDFTWPTLPATLYLEYQHNGNRIDYESKMVERRSVLSKLVIAELLEKKGKYIPQIANGLWVILEESTWVLPAHIVSQRTGIGLPDPEDIYIDLGAGKTSIDIAFVGFMLKKELDQYSPQLYKRIYSELQKRILKPYVERYDFWWMDFGKDPFVNNWNVWVNTNVVKTALLVDQDHYELEKILRKMSQSVDKFINSYPEDGAADEGATYWQHAGGELGQLLFWLRDLSEGTLNFSSQQKIHNMGSFILNMHIAKSHFINFEDGLAVQYPPYASVWDYGSLFDDNELKGFAAYLYSITPNQLSTNSTNNFFSSLWILKDLKQHSSNFNQAEDVYYKSLQLLVARSKDPKGLIFSAIGGNNGFSHNHNDVGSFMLYAGDQPILIDAGVGTYTKTTFSSKRYTLWNMQSQWHNAPIINGFQQKDGKQYAAKNAEFITSANQDHFSVDVSSAYPADAAVKKWIRNFDFDKATNRLSVTENYELTKFIEPSQIVLLTNTKPEISDKSIIIPFAANQVARISVKSQGVKISVDEKILEDKRFSDIWGPKLYRIKLTPSGTETTGNVDYEIKLIKE